jgi:hypothetical protein
VKPTNDTLLRQCIERRRPRTKWVYFGLFPRIHFGVGRTRPVESGVWVSVLQVALNPTKNHQPFHWGQHIYFRQIGCRPPHLPYLYQHPCYCRRIMGIIFLSSLCYCSRVGFLGVFRGYLNLKLFCRRYDVVMTSFIGPGCML